MGTAKVVLLSEVWAALDQCAPGHTRSESKEYWTVRYGKHVFPRLPLGKHGNRKDPEIFAGHVRTMVRLFEVHECVKQVLPAIW